jgi:peroxidase
MFINTPKYNTIIYKHLQLIPFHFAIMASSSLKGFVWLLFITCMIGISSAQLSNNFYSKTCPGVLRTIRKTVKDVVKNEKRMGASLLRLHFHDCFVQVINYSQFIYIIYICILFNLMHILYKHI